MRQAPPLESRKASHAASEGADLLGPLQTALRLRGNPERWSVDIDGAWCRVTPSEYPLRAQGWKLHVSTTLPLAETVLARTVPVLLDAGCAFTFAATRQAVALLNAAHTPRGNAGKFITAYPARDTDIPILATALHEATVGLSGPRVLTDHPYRPDSLVHYRYGSFVDQRVLSNDGVYRDVTDGPAGEPSDDRPEARSAPPAWAPPVFAPDDTDPASTSGVVLLGDRFLVRDAIRHANHGGVYRARDIRASSDVVIKEARPHVAVTPAGSDARDALRAETQVLQALAPLGVSPHVIALFEQDDHVFLAKEMVAGTPLRRWTADRVHRGGTQAHWPAALPIADALASLMQITHAAGFALRDCNPDNLVVLADGHLRLLDLELASTIESPADFLVGGTRGYSAPEQLAGAAPAPSADLFSLGAILWFLFTGADPVPGEDEPPSRTLRERLDSWLSSGPAAAALPTHMRSLIMRLLDDRPQRRGTVTQARQSIWTCRSGRHIRTGTLRTAIHRRAAAIRSRLSEEQIDDSIDGITAHLLSSMTPGDREQLWPMAASDARNDPCNVQHGAAGVLGALAHCYRLTHDRRLPEVLATTCEWIERRQRVDTFRPPGLYFGSAGIAWALYDAGRALGDQDIMRRAVESATSLPVEWPNPDLAHGTAGLGLTALHLWHATGEQEFADRAGTSAKALLRSAQHLPEGLGWQTPSSFDSVFAGQRSYGFAHGTAGIGYFLLACSATTPLPELTRRACRRRAEQAADTLLARVLDADGGARWGSGPGDDLPQPYWCSGSAGIGSFLLRLGVATGDTATTRVARQAVRSAAAHCWAGPLGQCHGIAGNAEYLLDTSSMTGIHEAAAQANELASMIFARRVNSRGRTVFPDDNNQISAEWAGGLSGVLTFLLRLRYGGPRRWMVDPATWNTEH